MIKSMTGFGAGVSENDNYTVRAEVRTLNSKFTDIFVRLPKTLFHRELEFRNMLTKELDRGKITLSVETELKTGAAPEIKINKALAKAYYQAFSELAEELEAPSQDIFRMVLQIPEVTAAASNENEELLLWELAAKAVKDALDACNRFRKDEGNRLEAAFKDSLHKIRQSAEKVAVRAPERIEKVRKRLTEEIAELLKNTPTDADRLEQEIIFYIEKLDIHEELVRLRSHLDYFEEVLLQPESNGKKLGFIAQEIGREINTIGSKANDADIQRSVVEMKEELEKIKEQSMNIL